MSWVFPYNNGYLHFDIYIGVLLLVSTTVHITGKCFALFQVSNNADMAVCGTSRSSNNLYIFVSEKQTSCKESKLFISDITACFQTTHLKNYSFITSYLFEDIVYGVWASELMQLSVVCVV